MPIIHCKNIVTRHEGKCILGPRYCNVNQERIIHKVQRICPTGSSSVTGNWGFQDNLWQNTLLNYPRCSSQMTNPLFNLEGLPPFSQIKPEHIELAIDQLLAESRKLTAQLLATSGPYTWNNLIEPLEIMDDRISRAWSPVSHMNSVVNSEPLRLAHNACLLKLSEYGTEMGQNRELYAAYQAISNHADGLDSTQRKILENSLRDFHLSGVDLESKERARFKKISQTLSSLTSRYGDNILDATNAWSKLISDKSELAGLPESALDLARQTAEQRGKNGWLLTLEYPSYLPVMTYADNRELRREMYEPSQPRLRPGA